MNRFVSTPWALLLAGVVSLGCDPRLNELILGASQGLSQNFQLDEQAVRKLLDKQNLPDEPAPLDFSGLLDQAAIVIGTFARQHPGLIDHLLHAPQSPPNGFVALPSGNFQVTVSGVSGETFQVVTSGSDIVTRELAGSIADMDSQTHQLEQYRWLYDVLQDVRQAAGPTIQSERVIRSPGLMTSAPASDLLVYNRDLVEELDSVILAQPPEKLPPYVEVFGPDGEEGAASQGTSTGDRNALGGGCRLASAHPTGIFAAHNWSLKPHVTSIKNQGARGTCTAFAVASALETLVSLQFDRQINVSEQDLYYLAKRADVGAGLYEALSFDAFEPFFKQGYVPPYEHDWTYNSGWAREVRDGQWAFSCLSYGEFCSDTTHQGGWICNGVPSTYKRAGEVCFSARPSTNSVPYAIHPVYRSFWDQESPDSSLALAKTLLDLGWGSVLMGFSTVPSFWNTLSDGIVAYDPKETWAGGGHSVHVVGYVDNETLARELPSAPPGSGGGYLIVKNSHGLCSGDAGFHYVPFDWAKKWTYSMVYLGKS